MTGVQTCALPISSSSAVVAVEDSESLLDDELMLFKILDADVLKSWSSP